MSVLNEQTNLCSAKRLEYIDVAKGLAMICVIAGHMGVSTVERLVFPFHMPLFF